MKKNIRYAVIYSSCYECGDMYSEILGIYNTENDAINAIDEDLSYIGFIIEDAKEIKENIHPDCKGYFQIEDCGNRISYNIQEI